MKKTIFLIFVLTIVQIVMAQDVIVTKQSERIDAKIIKVTETEIEYKQSNNPNGPTFTMSVSKIASILYSNGDVQSFNVKERSKNNSSVENEYKSGLCMGFSMPSDGQDQLYGGYLGYVGKLSFNDYLAFRDGLMLNMSGGNGIHMLDVKIPLLFEVGVNFDDNLGLFACVGPQFSFGISLGDELFDYPSYMKRFDFGMSVGGGFRFSKSINFEALYSFGLINRTGYSGSKLNCLTVGFNYFF